MKTKRISKFEKYLKELNDKEVEYIAQGLCNFTRYCIDNKYKAQRNALIDFALIAKYEYMERVQRALKEIKNNQELPY